MEELLGAVLAGVAELIAEFLLEAAFAELAGILSRAFRVFKAKVRRANPTVAAVIFGVAGVCSGFLSVWLFPHHLVHPTGSHGISLLISPVLTGLLMAQIGRTVRRWGRQSVRIESFGYGFIFARDGIGALFSRALEASLAQSSKADLGVHPHFIIPASLQIRAGQRTNADASLCSA